MNAPENKETSDLPHCQACGARQSERDKFCRQCGAGQHLRLAPSTGDANRIVRDTRPLLGTKHHDSFSGALVNVVTEAVSERASSLSLSLQGNYWMVRVAGALVAVPLWLMIVLLSPLDAYAAVRAIARRA